MSRELLDYIDRLEREHVEVRQALGALQPLAQANDSAALFAALPKWEDVLVKGLNDHSSLEDDVVFPQLADYLGSDLVAAFIGDHIDILAARDVLYAAGESSVNACLELNDLLGSHLSREEEILFPSARNAMS